MLMYTTTAMVHPSVRQEADMLMYTTTAMVHPSGQHTAAAWSCMLQAHHSAGQHTPWCTLGRALACSCTCAGSGAPRVLHDVHWGKWTNHVLPASRKAQHTNVSAT
jgi:hypothetical protein